MLKLQDAHTHLFSRPFFDALARLSPLPHKPEELLAEVSAKTGLEIPGEDLDAHRVRWIAEMDTHGVERMVTFASLPEEAPVVSEIASGSNGRLIPYTLVNPGAEGVLAFVEKSIELLGFRGLLAFPAMHHVPLDDPRWRPILELAQSKGTPLVVHCGILKVKLRDLMGIPSYYDIRLANPLGIVPAALRFPDLPFVIPHFGGGFFRELLMAGDQCENILVDTSSSNAWMKTDPQALDLVNVFRRCIDVLGASRILFGTDSSVFPRGYRDDVMKAQLDALERAGASSDDIAAIMGGNLQRLLP